MQHVPLQPNFSSLDHTNFYQAVQELGRQAQERRGSQDVKHLQKIELWGRLASLCGYLMSVIPYNPLAIFLISQGKFCRFTTVAHHVLHKAYDGLDTPKRYQSSYFAKGWRRFLDWFDLLYPAAWQKEHNVLHHFRLGERFDPDVFEHYVRKLQKLSWPRAVKLVILFLGASTWKWIYYAPSLIKQLHSPAKRPEADPYYDKLQLYIDKPHSPLHRVGRHTWLKSYLPYGLCQFILIPVTAEALGAYLLSYSGLGWAVFINILLAEWLHNLHTFAVIVPNHTGGDIYRFDSPAQDSAELCLRQVLGSVNYPTGPNLRDFMYGWLNYQIEHHVWPQMTLLQYQWLQPKLKELCLRFGVPYIQESLPQRLRRLIAIYLGDEAMQIWPQPSGISGSKTQEPELSKLQAAQGSLQANASGGGSHPG